jgi:hypothetical protein
MTTHITTQATPKAEPFTISSADTGLIPAANRADGTASVWSDIWKLQVPAGQMLVISPDDELSAYLEDASAEVGNNTARVRIAILDTSGHDQRIVYGPVAYVTVKEFQDRRKIARLRIPEPVKVYEEQFIAIQVYDDGAIDESDSAFQLSAVRVRQGLG